jgi:glycosyltransferase involved in cell wall biosynthesis
MKKISVITPCFNEAENVEICASELKRVMSEELPRYDYEHIFADNASTDATLIKLRTLAAGDSRIRVISNSRNVGPFRNMWNAMKSATGDAVIPLLPADLQDPPSVIPELVKKWDDSIVNKDGSKGAFVTDKTARTSAQAAGLITQSNLNQNQVVEIPTTGESVEENSVTFESPKGRVFLRIPGQGLVRLFNKKFNKTEAETIFDAMLNLAKNASANGSLYGNEKEEVNKNILNWLKSVVYW